MSYDIHTEQARAVYDASAARYVEFVGTRISAKTETVLDRSLLVAFTELVRAGPSGECADIGCGPGRVAAFLKERGLAVIGIDVSEGMLTVARSAHPHIRFEQGQLAGLPIESEVLAGAVSWYSIIYTPPQQLREVFSEIVRVLRPGGWTLLGFQAGDGEPRTRTAAHGTDLSLTNYLHSPQWVEGQLEAAGFNIKATVKRSPELAHETSTQCFLLARRPM